ncbi:hypothetical protein HYZ97_03775 [Candidatus Pacearchaeota archaeon]|nr:hypothetical protein [Candidatus Pacearchaeota archaeon]
MGIGARGQAAVGIDKDILGYLLIGLCILFLVAAGYLLFSGKAVGVLEAIKNTFRFGS